ncbi:MAG TPA: alpha/beta fold hydrolase [Blastocatellia bacterium]|nr:alpha/beta fold hydrolase [Blastocatellia bacterium]
MISKTQKLILKRIFWVFVPAVLVIGLGAVLLDFYFIYRLTHPPRTELYGTPRDFQVILQKPMWSDEKWKNADGTETVGWFLNQRKPAPAIILSHAYASNRSELLTLSFELWKAGYHVLVYDLRGHGESPVQWSGLGTYENEDILSAIKFIKGLKNEAGQELLDGRIGLYGVGLGGYASVVASAQDPMVKAIAVDSVYPDVTRFVNHKVKTLVGSETGWAGRVIDSAYASQLTSLVMQVYLLRRDDSSPTLESAVTASNRRILFMTGKDAGAVQEMTRNLHSIANDPKEFAEVEQTRLTRLYEKSESYDARVTAFFRSALPITDEKAKPVLRASK